MAIEITEFADVAISVAPSGVSGGNFGILGFLTNDADAAKAGREITIGERGRAYTSLASVTADWESSSEVYKAAAAFYGQTPTPKDFTAIVNFQNDTVGVLIGGGSGTPEEIIADAAVAWSGGEELISMNLDGVSISIDATDAINGADSTYDGIAANLTVAFNAALPGAVVTHNGYQFVVKGADAGFVELNQVTAASNTLAATALGLKEGVARAIDAGDAENAVDSLAGAVNLGVDFVGLVTHQEFRDNAKVGSGNQTTDIADWAEGSKKIFCNTTNDLTTLVSGSNNCIANVLKDKTLRFTLTTFSRTVDSYPSASVFGRAASVNFSSIGSTITLNLKQMPGVSAEDLTPSEFAALRGYFASAVLRLVRLSMPIQTRVWLMVLG